MVHLMEAAGIQPDLNTLNALLNMYAEAGQPESVEDIFGKLPNYGLKVRNTLRFHLWVVTIAAYVWKEGMQSCTSQVTKEHACSGDILALLQAFLAVPSTELRP